MKARQCIDIVPTVVIVGDEYFKREMVDGRKLPIFTQLS